MTDQTTSDNDAHQSPEEDQNREDINQETQAEPAEQESSSAPNPATTPPPPAPTPYSPPPPLTPSEERTWSMVSHLSILANLVTGFLGPVIPLVIYLAFKDRSRYVAFQSMQAFQWLRKGPAAPCRRSSSN